MREGEHNVERHEFWKSLKPLAKELLQKGKTNLKSTEEMKEKMEVQGSHRTLFHRQPSRKHISSYSTVIVALEGSAKKVSFEKEPDEGKKKEKPSMVITLPVKSEKMLTKGTQTDYRDSEAQTVPWKHEITADRKILSELFILDWFSLENNFPPGAEEVRLIEHARQKLAWENVIERLRGKENEAKRKSLVLTLAANERAFREERKEEENRERLEMSRRKMQEALEIFEEKLLQRLEKLYCCRKGENLCRIDYLNHQLNRKIRKVKSARGRPPTKSDIVSIHKDRGSELWAPKLRDGENPALGHEVIDIQCRYLKRFHGLEILEKHIANNLISKFPKSELENCRKMKKLGRFELSLNKFGGKVFGEAEGKKFDGISLKIAVPAPTPEASTARPTLLLSDSEENLQQL